MLLCGWPPPSGTTLVDGARLVSMLPASRKIFFGFGSGLVLTPNRLFNGVEPLPAPLVVEVWMK